MGIKSFQGPRANQEEEIKTPLLVKDYMTKKLVTFSPDQTLLEAMGNLVNHKISGGPVINDDNELIGIISEGDCLKQITQSHYYNMPMNDIKVADYMVKEVKTITSDSNIFEVADLFLSTKIRRFPVMEHGKLVGQITQKDILAVVLQMKGQSW
ncbi:MAG: CBS domain-containing protein [Flavobacteriaceae bacterium]|jgi:CBS domain-containing protein|nr:CBS domain-containing protein [Flavobacteriaceae bacterium]